MPYTRNIAFTVLIKINGRLKEFNFRRRSSSLYDVDTNDERGERYFFKAEYLHDRWAVSGADLPAWLSQGEKIIADTLLEQEKTFQPA
ncbi:MAG: hypothetical protein EOO01_31095 [Chitinophagaceae bacterium]|nr:MAG: hypothetical protein EOO01_31095 [Chitinophagaceae bacterium]